MKLKETKIEYKVLVQNRVVIAKAVYNALCSKGIPVWATKAEGVAVTKSEPFNINTGKKLARARAEKAAYIKFRDYLKEQMHLKELILAEMQKALQKATKHIESQRKYIKKF